jgi:Protein of unknown function (DUF3592)
LSAEVLISLLFIVVGAGFVIWSVFGLVSAVLSRQWPSVPGTIVVSDLHRANDEGSYTYRPEVCYRYSVSGTEYVANVTRYGDGISLSTSKPAVKTVRKYPVGKLVTVHYNPHNPSEAVLEPGVNWLIAASFAMGAVFVVAGTFALRAALAE